jgi:uncharacterized protein YhaN
VPTFQERARGYQRLKENIENLDQEQTHYLAGQTKEQLEQQQRQAVEECKKLEEQMRTLASAPGGVGDIPSLHAEISRLESAGSQGTTGGPDAERGPARAVAVTPSTNHSWIEALRARWPSDDTALQAAISTLFAKLSGGHYAKVEWGDNGLRIYSATQQLIDPELLSSGQRDLLALACFLAPWGSSRAGKGKNPASRFPLLLDEPFLSLDGAGQSACLQLLRALAPAQQVILATRLHVAEEAADHRIALPLAPQAAEATNR